MFRIQCESVHSCSSVNSDFTFLDLDVTLRVPSLRVEYSQHKPVIPLCASSAHSPAVHASWPGSVSNRASNLSDAPAQAREILLSRYRHANAHIDVVSRFRNWQPQPSAGPQVLTTGAQFVFVMRYHPSFRHAFHKALGLVPLPAYYQMSIKPAWKNALPTVAGSIASHNDDLCRREFGKEGSACVLSNTSTESRHKFMLPYLLHHQ